MSLDNNCPAVLCERCIEKKEMGLKPILQFLAINCCFSIWNRFDFVDQFEYTVAYTATNKIYQCPVFFLPKIQNDSEQISYEAFPARIYFPKIPNRWY